jgi:hypothetical protein
MIFLVAVAGSLVPAIDFGLSPNAATGAWPTLAAPAGITARLTSAAVPLSFVPACEPLTPKVTFVQSGDAHPAPRDRNAKVEVFLVGSTPERRFVEVGQLEVLGRSSRHNLTSLIEAAQRRARAMGGDALVEVRPNLEVSPRRTPMTLTARVVRWI